jgi:hypothetical protein
MLRDLSKTLENVLHDPAQMPDYAELKNAEIAFDRPTDPYGPAKSTINVFLYDLRENAELRSNEPRIRRKGDLAFTEKPPLRLSCSYLVTAWPSGGTDLVLQEHRLLGQVIRVLARYPTIPESLIVPGLKGQEPPLPLMALHPDALKNVVEFWTSIGSKLKPSITVTVTISVPVLLEESDFLVRTQATRFAFQDGPPSEVWTRIAGLVADTAGKAIQGARVDVLDAGLSTQADEDGHYSFDRVPSGNRRLRATAVGFQAKEELRNVPGPPENYDFKLTPL